MNNYLDLTKYSDSELLNMLREKQKEYIILIQSEKVAKMILDYYGEEFFTGAYHTRVNNEYYLLHERAAKKAFLSNDPYFINETKIGIPLRTVITRLEESRDEVLKNDKSKYAEYSIHLTDIVGDINYNFFNKTIYCRDGYLYLTNDNEDEIPFTPDLLKEIMENGKVKQK